MIRSTELAHFLKTSPQVLNSIRTKENFSEVLIDEKDPISSELLGSTDTLKGPRNRYFSPMGSRKILQKKNFPFERKIISFANLKGGVGKTSLCCHFAKMANNFGFRVLAADMDKQGNLTSQLIPNRPFKNVLYNLITKDKNFHCELDESIIKVSDFLSVIPSNLNNQRLEQELSRGNINTVGYFSRLFKKLDFDLFLLDCEPNLSLTNLMALSSSDLVIAPVRLDKNSIDGLQMVMAQISDLKSEWKNQINLKVKAVINGFDGRLKSSMGKISELQNAGIDVFDTVVRADHSFVRHQDGVALNPKSKAFEDMATLVLEVLDINNNVIFQ